MNMRWMPAVLIMVATALSGCDKKMTAAQKAELLENQRLEILADLHRQQAECQAQAIELANAPMVREKIVAGCIDTYQAMVAISQKSLANLGLRIAELQPSAIPFSGKLDGEK